jgi:hypothetical protein
MKVVRLFRPTVTYPIYGYDQWKFQMRKSTAKLTLMDAIGFTEEDLEANRNEYITKKQRMRLDRERNAWKSLRVLAMLACPIGIIIAIWDGIRIHDTVASRIGISGFIIVMTTGIATYTWLKMRGFSADLYKGEVSVISGQVKLRSEFHRNGWHYSVKIQNVKFPNIPQSVFQAFEEGSYYNIYYAPHSKMIFSAERL